MRVGICTIGSACTSKGQHFRGLAVKGREQSDFNLFRCSLNKSVLFYFNRLILNE